MKEVGLKTIRFVFNPTSFRNYARKLPSLEDISMILESCQPPFKLRFFWLKVAFSKFLF